MRYSWSPSPSTRPSHQGVIGKARIDKDEYSGKGFGKADAEWHHDNHFRAMNAWRTSYNRTNSLLSNPYHLDDYYQVQSSRPSSIEKPLRGTPSSTTHWLEPRTSKFKIKPSSSLSQSSSISAFPTISAMSSGLPNDFQVFQDTYVLPSTISQKRDWGALTSYSSPHYHLSATSSHSSEKVSLTSDYFHRRLRTREMRSSFV